jgi:hypothetical protein
MKTVLVQNGTNIGIGLRHTFWMIFLGIRN